MGDESVSTFIRELIAGTDTIARRIREWNDYRLEQHRRTIEIQAHEALDIKASTLAEHKLKQSQQWVQLEKQKQQLQQQKWENWKLGLFRLTIYITNGWSGWGFYIFSMIVSASLGGTLLINMPPSITCPSQQTLCFWFRLDKSTIILPEQADEILQRYLENHPMPQPQKKQRQHKGP